jgi:hypothetical protein
VHLTVRVFAYMCTNFYQTFVGRAIEALPLGKYNFSCVVIGLTFINSACRQQPEPLNLGVPVVYFPRANAFRARAQALLWARDC